MKQRQSLMKHLNYDKIVSQAHLIMMNPEGEVLLTKDDDGVYSLPYSELLAKKTLEDSLRLTMKDTWDIEVGTVTLLGADSGYSKSHFELNTIYYTEDYDTSKDYEYFSVEALPMTISKQSESIVEAYVEGVKVTFMNYLALHGDIL